MRHDDQNNLTPAEREVELALTGLMPIEPAIHRDRLMFEAGRRSAGRTRHTWQAVAAVLAASLALSVLLPTTHRPVPMTQHEPIAVTQTSIPLTATVPASASGYLEVRRRVLDEGLNALPTCRPMPPSRMAPPEEASISAGMSRIGSARGRHWFAS